MAFFDSTESAVKALVFYGLKTGLIEADDAVFAANGLFDALKFEPDSSFGITADEIHEAMKERGNLDAAGSRVQDSTGASDGSEYDLGSELESILQYLLDDAVNRGVIDSGIASRDLFDTRLMGVLTPRPSIVTGTFAKLYKESPEKATDYFYKLSRDSDYIRTYRVRRDRKWVTRTKYGDIDITINLSKPEKDPKAIAAALHKKQDAYPKCLLCPTNIGYAGRLDHPARETIRLIPMELGGSTWYMQYSPYVYYNEHCIVLSGEHTPMKIDRATFVRLLEFITRFPHYTIGSNADLPIVGGSILTHEHFQGGRYEFAMARASLRENLTFAGFDDVKAGIVNWPMSVIRLDAADAGRLVELADRILASWRGYSDESVGILAFTEERDGDGEARRVPHNTITPIARRRGEMYELDLVLRNNRTTPEYPLGIFHPHADKHHIKKENIGLIEVMGLAVLPARLLKEMAELKKAVFEGRDAADDPATAPHAEWMKTILDKYPEYRPENVKNADPAKFDEILREEIGIVFSGVLEDAGVYKDDEAGRAAFEKFIGAVNGK